MSENRCVCCGQIVPEGEQVCITCKNEADRYEWQVTRDRKRKKVILYVLTEWVIPLGVAGLFILFLVLAGQS